jgi:hypothetical protein
LWRVAAHQSVQPYHPVPSEIGMADVPEVRLIDAATAAVEKESVGQC